MTLRIAHVVADLHPKSGGPSRTVTHLVDALTNTGVEVSLFSQSQVNEPFIAPESAQVRLSMARSAAAWRLKLGLPLKQTLEEQLALRPPHILHSHGLWLPVNHWATQWAQQQGIPLIIHPRGMLEPWAMQQSARKKAFAMALFQRSDLYSARLIVATSSMEFNSIRALGMKQPIAVIPNGIHFNSHQISGISAHQKSKTVLFLSRLHPKKGIKDLITAWSVIRPSGWRLCIAGPDEGGHLAEMKKLTSQLNLETEVDFIGEVQDNNKHHVFNSSSLFVLPTYSENFGVVVAEALSHGLPVITTKGAPWEDLVTYGCGWWIDRGVDALIPALREGIGLSPDSWKTMSDNARAYVRRFDWNSIALDMKAAYHWALGSGDRPDCVHIK